ncbi:MAG: hypothetical protein KA153_00055 [Hyphomonadaceae bacterium]|jgi:putative adenylate-forming enzyme|nr:hypothetical protein [Hyphomonadaceae bacterium]
MSIDRFSVLRAYLGTRRAQTQLRTREDIERRQAKLWRKFTPVIARTPALAHLAGSSLERFPVVQPHEIRARFGDWNTVGLGSEAANAAASDAERGGPGDVAPGISAGFSTGTSGSRGVFLASRAERAQYLGQALAKLLPWDGLLKRRRIALCLRADSSLYRDVRDAGPFQFHFVQLGASLDTIQRELKTFDPHVFVAPSHILAGLSRNRIELKSIERVYYGAEPMGDAERAWIADVIGIRPDPIYQATEGFLGAACRHGALHLNEDTLVIERTPVEGTKRFAPIVTDLRRTTQPMVRVQLDDLLEPVDAPCPCGSALLAVRGVEGRVGDLWRWDDVAIAPREVEETVSRAVGADIDWCAIGSAGGVHLEMETRADAAVVAIEMLLAARGVKRTVGSAAMAPMEGFKRRRVRWRYG